MHELLLFLGIAAAMLLIIGMWEEYRRSATSEEIEKACEYLEPALLFYIRELGLEEYCLDSKQFSISIGPLESSVKGMARMDLKTQKTEVVINARDVYGIWAWLTKPEIILAHEMIHIQQFVTGRLKYEGKYSNWEGKKYPHWWPYSFQPWEREAFKGQKRLYKKYKESLGVRSTS